VRYVLRRGSPPSRGWRASGAHQAATSRISTARSRGHVRVAETTLRWTPLHRQLTAIQRSAVSGAFANPFAMAALFALAPVAALALVPEPRRVPAIQRG
jgi:hypothetical protein